MIAILCFFVPPIILLITRKNLLKESINFYNDASIYFISVLGLNFLMMFVLYHFFDNNDTLYLKLNSYNNFACKYIFLSVILAVTEPCLEFFLRKKLKFFLPKLHKVNKIKYSKLYVSLYASFLFFLNFIRIFDNNFWADETATIVYIMKGNFASIAEWAANDVHPPLYYFMLKIVYLLIGNRGWAFHLLSLLPCLIIMILSLTIFWREFSWKVSVIIITIIGLSYNSVYYNMEVRMYSWAGLFVLLSYYGLWRILVYKRPKDSILFIVFSLCAAYTHYFAMITVAFFYVMIMIISIFTKRIPLKVTFIIWISTILGYFPWTVKFLKTIQRTTDNYWITDTPTLQSALKYLFSSRFQSVLSLIILLGAVIVFFLYETTILNITVNKNKCVHISINFEQINFSNIALIVTAGIFCVLGTIIFAISYSFIVRPIFTYRYIYATSMVAWMVLAIIISKLNLGKIWIPILCLFLIFGFVPRYQEIYIREKNLNDTLQSTLDEMSQINTDGIILTNDTHVPIHTINYYFPDMQTQILEESNLEKLDKTSCYYLIISEKTDIRAILEKTEELGFCHTQIVSNGNLTMGNFGPNIVDIYQLFSPQ